ncbi:MAG TPA: hypothetical protein VJO35_18740 [Terriglobales bacterium]|nr:hypothetical protein [Terriglobales bacterium]
MIKKREPKKPKVMWVGNTPITPITAKQSRELDKRLQKRYEKLRRRYPELHGRIVDYVSHSIEDGSLFVNVAFQDRTGFSLRFDCQMFVVGADLLDWRSGNGEIIREYMKRSL